MSSSDTPMDNELDHLRLVELFFFAYRDFTHDPDKILAEYGFGRAHHRVLHFVMRNPGLVVSDLLKILKITKQSLAPILKKLIIQEFIHQEEGKADRRQRSLYLTEKGHSLTKLLCDAQLKRFENALQGYSDEERLQASQFLFGLTDEDDHHDIRKWISSDRTYNHK